MEIKVVCFREPNGTKDGFAFVAQGLDLDICAQASDYETLIARWTRQLMEEVKGAYLGSDPTPDYIKLKWRETAVEYFSEVHWRDYKIKFGKALAFM